MARKNVQFKNNPLLGGPTLSDRSRSGSPYRELAISDIDFDPEQPRKVFDEQALKDLSLSIKEYGVLTPILVTLTAGGSYRLVAGERRLRASKLAGLSTIPTVVEPSESDAKSRLAKQLVENVQRENLTAMERSIAIGQLKERHKWSIREIASRVGLSKAVVQRSMEILELPDDLQAALIEGASESKVLVLGRVKNRDLRKELLARIDDYTRVQLESAIKQLESEAEGSEAYHGGTSKTGKKKKLKLSVEDKRIVEDVQRGLGMKVALSRGQKKGQGKLSIEFYSDADLQELYKRLTA